MLKLAPAGTGAAEQLMEEGALLARLSHPSLVEWTGYLLQATDVGLPGSASGFAMEWIDGVSLTEGADARTLDERLREFGQLLDAIDYMHRCGVLHLDIKPDNVLRTSTGVCLLDLGSARPLDSGPGEAGGTLGYAAPEVLMGQAASVAADLFSLGAVLYELLTGQLPYRFEGSGGSDRAALLSETLVPVRALVGDVPMRLAKLAESLLSMQPFARPRDVSAVRDELREQGVSWASQPGSPPMFGREGERAAAGGALAAGRGVLLLGPKGSGRGTLGQAVLRDYARSQGPTLDLSTSPEPLTVLGRQLGLPSLTTVTEPVVVGQQISQALSGSRSPWQGAVFFGRREERSGPLLALLDAAADALQSRGCAVMWAGVVTSPPRPGVPRPVTVPVEGLSEAAMESICRFYGVHAPARIRETCRDVRGLPGTLIRQLAPQMRSVSASDATEAMRLFSVLSAGVPESFIARLPAPLQLQARQLIERGEARWSPDRRLFSERRTSGELQPETVEAAAALLAEEPQDDVLWWVLSAARLGRMEIARARFRAACDVAVQRPSELEELCERLHADGYNPATRRLVRLRRSAGDLKGAISLLEQAGTLDEEQEFTMIVLLRRMRRYAESIQRAQVALRRAEKKARLWMEIAYSALHVPDLPLAEEALNAAETADPDLAAGVGLMTRLRLLSAHYDTGTPPPEEEMERRLRQVEDRLDDPTLSGGVLMTAAMLMRRLNQLSRALPLLERVSTRADESGDRRLALGTRINRALLLRDLGRISAARKVAIGAVKIAEEGGVEDLQVQLIYQLIDLELDASRLPEGQRWGERFLSATATAPVGGEMWLRRQKVQARLALEQGSVQSAAELLLAGRDHLHGTPRALRAEWTLLEARALLALGDADGVLSLLAEREVSTNIVYEARIRALEGQALLLKGRAALREARENLPRADQTGFRLYIGEVLMAAAGEDLDPETFPDRRKDLETAMRLLRGNAAARAAALRDRLLDGPAADLSGVVKLTESMADPRQFPAALAKLITQALGAHRVLIMLKIPGLGQQMSYNELSGSEAAGIGAEVLRRIQRPDDYWLADDAFNDPRLRASSQTVRTFELKSLVAVAIPYQDKAVGALYVDALYRAGRFGKDDVAILRQLANAVGRMIPLLQRNLTEQTTVIDPQEVMGVLSCQPRFIEEISHAASMVRGQRESNLLITGETGTGKSVLAGRIARDVLGRSGLEVVVLRKGDPNMLIAQLSGSRRGDFTGAVDQEGAIPARPAEEPRPVPRRGPEPRRGGAADPPPPPRDAQPPLRRPHRGLQDPRRRPTHHPRHQRRDPEQRLEEVVPRGPVVPHEHHPHRPAPPARSRRRGGLPVPAGDDARDRRHPGPRGGVRHRRPVSGHRMALAREPPPAPRLRTPGRALLPDPRREDHAPHAQPPRARRPRRGPAGVRPARHHRQQPQRGRPGARRAHDRVPPPERLGAEARRRGAAHEARQLLQAPQALRPPGDGQGAPPRVTGELTVCYAPGPWRAFTLKGCTRPTGRSPSSTTSTLTSATASSSSSSGRAAAASPPCCAASPAWRPSPAATSASASSASTTSIPATATSPWSSRATRSTRT